MNIQLTREEKIEVLKKWEDEITQSDEWIEQLLDCPLQVFQVEFFEPVWKLSKALTETASTLVGDNGGWLEWYRESNLVKKREGSFDLIVEAPSGEKISVVDVETLLIAIEM